VVPLIVILICVYLSAPVTNLALFNPNGSCTVSSFYGSLTCDGAFDGETEPAGTTTWATNSGSDGEWIQREFPGRVLITHVVVWHACALNEQYQTITFTFSDGQTIQVCKINVIILKQLSITDPSITNVQNISYLHDCIFMDA
jgi:hypothetical protein